MAGGRRVSCLTAGVYACNLGVVRRNEPCGFYDIMRVKDGVRDG